MVDENGRTDERNEFEQDCSTEEIEEACEASEAGGTDEASGADEASGVDEAGEADEAGGVDEADGAGGAGEFAKLVELGELDGRDLRELFSGCEGFVTVGGERCDQADEQDRRFNRRLIIALIVIMLLLCLLLLGWCSMRPEPVDGVDTGSRIIPIGDMSDGEAQQLIDDMAEKSRITVSLSPTPLLDEEQGKMRVNFVVVPDNNGYAERLEVEQDGQVVYKSGIVQPGYRIEWANTSQAHEGAAIATVHAVDQDGNDCGNPASVEINIAKA